MAKLLTFVVLTLAVSFCHSDEEAASAAKLLFSKQILNRYLVEGMDINIRYSLFNVGGSAALNVQVADNSFSLQDFSLVGGQPKFNLDRIPAGTNVTHVVVIRPLKYGYYNFTAAEVTYSLSEDANQVQIGYSSEPGQGVIVPFKEFDRKFSSHMLDWAAFAVMTLPSLAIPFLLWFSSKSKYEALLSQKDKKKDH
uniref:Translocon-associated protein subunit beta n=1 Tax=Lynceus sp. MCZ IZ 141354 TaxID=1930659 RepID=A0A9N6WUG8_9CRUS|nr:EOG090X0EPM [Lynceus sp. MCZ IZ 141354]